MNPETTCGLCGGPLGDAVPEEGAVCAACTERFIARLNQRIDSYEAAVAAGEGLELLPEPSLEVAATSPARGTPRAAHRAGRRTWRWAAVAGVAAAAVAALLVLHPGRDTLRIDPSGELHRKGAPAVPTLHISYEVAGERRDLRDGEEVRRAGALLPALSVPEPAFVYLYVRQDADEPVRLVPPPGVSPARLEGVVLSPEGEKPLGMRLDDLPAGVTLIFTTIAADAQLGEEVLRGLASGEAPRAGVSVGVDRVRVRLR